MNDRTLTFTTRIARPAAEVRAWLERPGVQARLTPPWSPGALESPGSPGTHRTAVRPDGPAACWLDDHLTVRLPLGALGRGLAGGWANRRLARIFRWRHAVTKADLELAAGYGPVPRRRILLAGGSGLIGQALGPFLQTQGHEVVRLVRREPAGTEEIRWDPARGECDAARLEGIDAVVNLSGENVGAGRWTEARRRRIRSSRLDATRTLGAAVARLGRPPAVWVNASAVGFYGDAAADPCTETGPAGRGFLVDVVQAWEEAAVTAAGSIREVRLRFGVVLSSAGGALPKMLPLFRAGLGGRLGAGRQWFSWISSEDAVGAVYHALVDPRLRGPVNGVAPGAVTNAEFTATLAAVLGRPGVCAVPAALLRGVFGPMADETLLASTRAVPQVLTATDYRFRQPGLEGALRHALGVGA